MKTGTQHIATPKATNSSLYYIGLICLVLFTSGWILTNLHFCMLWQDEGETVCVAQTVLTEGIPKGTDGTNFFSQQEGREYGENQEWKLHPWFQFYWVALFFSFFEQTTFMARFPFALLGIGTVLFSFFLARRLWKDERTAWFVAIAFLVNIFFLLLVRQARYYAPVMFFSIYGIWGLLDLLEGKKQGYFHYIIASLLFFQSQYLFTMNFWMASLLYTGIFYRDRLKAVALSVGIAALPSIPFLLWILDTPYGETLTQGPSEEGLAYGLERFGKTFFSYVLEPIWLMVLVPFFFFKEQLKKLEATKESEQIAILFILLILGNIVAIALFVPEYYLRYLCATIPFALLLKGRIASWISTIHIAVPIVLLMSIVLYKGDLKNYTTELQIPQEGEGQYLGPMEGIVNFVRNECKSTDKIAISFGDLPLKFYLDNPIYGGLAGDLPENLEDMDVIIIRRNPIHQMDLKVQTRLNEYVQANLDKFNAFGLRVQDMPFENRETPEEHRYEPWQGAPTNPVVIHKRKQ